MFDVQKLANFALSEIEKFSKEHPNETFYTFAIDSSLLCMNSIEHFEKSLKEFASKSPRYYDSPDQIRKLRESPKAWAYNGFVCFRSLNVPNGSDSGPFDENLYKEHCDLDREAQEKSAYAIAMDQVLEILRQKDAFRVLKKISDFRILSAIHPS
ncbi:hypothetical protein A0128_05625 [Leptospira tipperaryensis]|uniref:DUF4303 domain-containing protein n=1 Tax=Leptospira tipperaryensis TaxID=2564040 RepID=A0A1D7UUU9_9LEPT|nr:DUF4303 domain-containing protein [Leptospira tipperaryensis]AOP33369.1 hypothetical protein A0128_05625 [Leptospira tipperaryensis]